METNNQLKTAIIDALVHFFFSLVYILFICPFRFWEKATLRLADARRTNALSINGISSRWPFLTFIKRVFFDFGFDGFIFISYFLGIILAIISLVKVGVGAFIVTLISIYYIPFFVSYIRDMTIIFVVLPIRKLLSWLAKPAQQLNLDIRNQQ